MKSLYFTEDHQVFREAVRQFIENEIAPFIDDWEEAARIPREIWQKMGQQDLLGISYPEAYGGTEADFFYSVVLLEELARSNSGGFAAAVGVHQYIALTYIHKYGTEAQKEAYLKPGIAGEKIGALAISEPDTGSDVANLRTRAEKEGDHYLINGAKTFITNGHYGDFIVTAVRTGPDPGAGGISLLVVDKESEGFSSRQLKKIGWHCSDTAELSFNNVRVPAGNLLGGENMGFYYIMECFVLERLVAAVGSLAGADYGLEITLKYINERKAFNRLIAKFQVIRHNLSDLATELEAARQLTYNACWLYAQGEQATKEAAMAKLYTSELAKKLTDVCLQYFGGYGYIDDYLISRFYRDVRVGTIVGGTSEIMREIISKIVIDNVEYESVEEPPGSEISLDIPVEEIMGKKEKTSASGNQQDKRDYSEPLPTVEIRRELDKVMNAREEDKNNLAAAPSAKSPADLSPEEAFKQELDRAVEDMSAKMTAEANPAAGENHTTDESTSQNDTAVKIDTVEGIFNNMPERFRPEKAEGYNTVFHFKISGAQGGEYTVIIENGKCQVEPGLKGSPKCIVQTKDRTYIDIETGKANPQVAFMMGKVKVSNVPEMIQFAKMFHRLKDT